jgi:hypothetical protein
VNLDFKLAWNWDKTKGVTIFYLWQKDQTELIKAPRREKGHEEV